MKARLLRASWFVCLLTAAGLILTSAQQDVTSIQLEGILELLPDKNSVTEPITGVLWKHGPNKVAEWDQGFGPDVDYYGIYKKRTDLNKETGKLVINNMNIEDSGIYSVEVNGRLQNKNYKVEVTIPIPPPWGWIFGGIIIALILAVGLMLGVKYRDHIKNMLP